MTLETNVWVWGKFIAPGVSLLPGPLCWQNKEMHVVPACACWPVGPHASTNISFHVCIKLIMNILMSLTLIHDHMDHSSLSSPSFSVISQTSREMGLWSFTAIHLLNYPTSVNIVVIELLTCWCPRHNFIPRTEWLYIVSFAFSLTGSFLKLCLLIFKNSDNTMKILHLYKYQM